MADSAEDQRPAGSSRARTAVVVVVAVIVALGISWALAARNQPKGTPQEFLKADKVGDKVTRIGPEAFVGNSVRDYIKARAKAVSDAKDARVAVVSLDRYTTEREARAAVGNSEVLTLIAATPGGMPSVVERDLKAWADREREEAKVERDGFKSQIPTVDDAVTRKQFEDDVQRLTALIDRVSPTGPVVFAVVIRAPADRLREIAKSPGTRLVDVGSSATLDAHPKYFGIRPEETKDLGEPKTRPL